MILVQDGKQIFDQLAAAALNKENASRYRASELSSLVEKQPVYVVVEPSDVLPAADEARVRGLLSSGKEAK